MSILQSLSFLNCCFTESLMIFSKLLMERSSQVPLNRQIYRRSMRLWDPLNSLLQSSFDKLMDSVFRHCWKIMIAWPRMTANSGMLSLMSLPLSNWLSVIFVSQNHWNRAFQLHLNHKRDQMCFLHPQRTDATVLHQFTPFQMDLDHLHSITLMQKVAVYSADFFSTTRLICLICLSQAPLVTWPKLKGVLAEFSKKALAGQVSYW